jgi:hypothetical protein
MAKASAILKVPYGGSMKPLLPASGTVIRLSLASTFNFPNLRVCASPDRRKTRRDKPGVEALPPLGVLLVTQ